MNTLEICHILSSNPVTKNFFNGVFSVDTLSLINEKPKLIICNTDISTGKGKHWILIFFNETNDNVEFFDSLGYKPSFYGPDFMIFMKKFSTECYFTPVRIQPINSDLCGQYCCFYAHKRCQGFNMKYILNNIPSPYIIKMFSHIYLKHYKTVKKLEEKTCQKCIEF